MGNNLIIKRNSKGRGVYTGRVFKKGEVICKVTGKVKSWKEMIISFDKYSYIMHPLQIGPKKYFELDVPYIFLNHSCSPNAGIKGETTLFAIRDIKKGEEITFDYSTTIDESFVCKCGSKNCRGAVSDFFALPKKTQKFYIKRKAVPEFILKKYKKCCGK